MPIFVARGPIALPSGGAAVTLNPNDKSTDIQLSDFDLTADHPDGSTDLPVAVRSTVTAGAAQKVYVEYTAVRVSFRISVGFGNASAPLGARLGDDAFPSNALGLDSVGDFQMNAGNGQAGLTGPFIAGDTVDTAWDIGANKIWFRINNGTWNSGLGTGDPATGTLGFTTAIVAGPYYAMLGLRKAKATVRFKAADWIHTVPSGFSALT